MNPISAFFVRNIVFVFFLYGLAFFVLGIALALASRRTSEFRFVQAIRPLAAFGIAHGIHEWLEMFQKIATLTQGYVPVVSHEILRLVILATSFLMLSAFGVMLLSSGRKEHRRVYLLVSGLVGLWLLSVWVIKIVLEPSPDETIALADVLARYSMGIPGALIACWALMTQQRTFREHGMPRFGRDLVWCATALLMYGVIGQAFVRETSLAPSNVLNSTNFLQWFGIPVQLFRGTMASILALFMVRALNAFELENQRRLEAANEAKLKAQEAALEAQRRVSREMERLNADLQLTTRELSLLLSLFNLLATPMSLEDRLHTVLEKIVHSLSFPDAGLTLLITSKTGALDTSASVNFDTTEPLFTRAQQLGHQCVEKAMTVCRHADGMIFEFSPENTLNRERCHGYPSPVTMISLPLAAREQVIGSIVLCRKQATEKTNPSPAEFKLMVGIAQQLGLSIENARLYQDAHEREELLGQLLHQAVGAQEAERQRIARELHDATGQSLTAIALGLRGVTGTLNSNPATALEQINRLKTFATDALGELRQFIADLRPSQLDDLGLVAALQWYIQEFGERFTIHTDFAVEGDQIRLPPEYETVLFRITQEALTNVAKHANANHVAITLRIRPAQISVEIRDDGCGFDPNEVLRTDRTRIGWGLLGIRERASLLGGQYKIESAPDNGTCIRVQVPLLTEAKGAKDTLVAG